MESGEFRDARNVLADALKELEKVYGKKSVELVPAISMLANINAKLGRTGEQEKLYKRALELTAKRYGTAGAQYADLSNEAGNSLLLYSGNRQTGIAMLQDARDVYVTLVNSSDPMSARTALAIGELLLQAGQFEATQHFFGRALERLSEDSLAPVEDLIRAHSGLVSSYVLDGKSEMADENCVAVRDWTYLPIPNAQDISRVAPIYPWYLQMTGAEGYVDLSFTVDKKGFVRSPEILVVEGHKDFVPAALRALCAFKYKPRIENGETISVDGVKTRISFELQ